MRQVGRPKWPEDVGVGWSIAVHKGAMSVNKQVLRRDVRVRKLCGYVPPRYEGSLSPVLGTSEFPVYYRHDVSSLERDSK
jgi:hypothetical protein